MQSTKCKLQIAIFPPLFLILFLAGCGGCRKTASSPAAGGREGPAVSSQYREELLTYAVDNIDRLDEFGSTGVLPQILERLNTLNNPTSDESKRQFDPLLDTWPEPEMLRQIVDRLNQWIRPQQPPADWKADPMLSQLPKSLADLPQVKNLGRMEFSRFDGYALQEAAWLRDVSIWARGDKLDDLEQAETLFNWVVRNIQLEPDSPNRIPLFPWETLFFGRGTATERAWVYVLLLRQMDVEAALLAVEKGEGAAEKISEKEEKGNEKREEGAEKGAENNAPGLQSGGGKPGPTEQPAADSFRPWCVGVLIEGKVYLFDPLLGLPIPSPNGVAHGKSGELTIHPATLAEVRADGKLLERMNLDETRTYGVKPSDLARVRVLLEGSPQYLACRMKMLESRLSGEHKMVLSASPSAEAGRWKEKAGLDDARLWLHPYQTLRRRSALDRREVASRLISLLPFYIIPSAPLFRGRVLYLKGTLVGDGGAIQHFQAARPSDAELRASSIEAIKKVMLKRGKQDSTYWCGLISYQRGDYASAIDYFRRRILEDTVPSPWINGARYNLARAYEASDQTERAILMYGLDSSSPGYFGDLLRAKWLGEENKVEQP